MLEKIKLRDFQRHRALEVELDPLVTTFVGPSRRGKSSVLRALGFAALNDPSAEKEVKRWGSKDAKATLFLDGHAVTRSRGKKGNHYYLDGKKFAAFGSKVPEEIADLLAVNEVNFQWQLDRPFWFLESASQVSRDLNRIVNLSAIDDALGRASAALNSVRSSRRVTESRKRSAEDKKESLAWVPRFRADVSAVLGLHERYARIRAKTALLGDILRRAALLRARVESRSKAILGAENALLWGRKAAAQLGRAESLRKSLVRLGKLRKSAARQIPDLGELTALRKRGDSLAERASELEGMLLSIQQRRKDLCQKNKELEKAKAELRSFSRGKVCPLCGRKCSSLHLRRTSTSATERRRLAKRKEGLGTM